MSSGGRKKPSLHKEVGKKHEAKRKEVPRTELAKKPPESQESAHQKETQETKSEPERKTAKQIALEETGPQGVSPEVSIIHGAEMEAGPLPKASPYTDFETLPVPTIHPSIATSVLQNLCRQIKLHTFIPSMYTTHCGAWELYEPAYYPPPEPKTNPATIKEPMLTAHFDEIWCPIPADSKEAESILPPTFCYMPTQKCS